MIFYINGEHYVVHEPDGGSLLNVDYVYWRYPWERHFFA